MVLALLAFLGGCQGTVEQDRREVVSANWPDLREMPRFSTLQDWEKRRETLLTRISATAGLYPPLEASPASVTSFEPQEGSGYTVRRVVLKTSSGLSVEGDLYRPLADKTTGLPAVLLAHGHKPKGRFTHDEYFSQRAFARHLAQHGIVVYSYDMIGYNDSLEFEHVDLGPEAALWGITLMGLQTENSRNALDFLLAQQGVDPSKVAMVGWSGGGTQAYLLAALDQRIKVSVPAAVVSRTVQDTCACGCAPNFRLDTSSGELAALAAPRPMLLVSAEDFTWETPTYIFPAIQRIYGLYDASEKVENAHVDLIWHNFNQQSRQAVYSFLALQFGLTIDPTESDQPFVDEALLRAGKPQKATAAEILATRKTQVELALKSWQDAPYRSLYNVAFPLQWPAKVLVHRSEGEKVWVGRRGREDLIPLQLRERPGDSLLTVLLTENGIQEASSISAGFQGSLLMLDPLGRGARPKRAKLPAENPFCYNLTDTLEGLQDCLTAIAYAYQKGYRQVKVVGHGKAGAWALLLSPLIPHSHQVVADIEQLPQSDQELVEHLYIPYFRRLGGFPTSILLSRAETITLRGSQNQESGKALLRGAELQSRKLRWAPSTAPLETL